MLLIAIFYLLVGDLLLDNIKNTSVNFKISKRCINGGHN